MEIDGYSFKVRNSEEALKTYMDLHGLTKRAAISKMDETLASVKAKSKKNYGNNTIYLIIAGAGTHSKDGKAVLKYAVPEYLTEKRYDFYSDTKQGQFLVKI